MAGKANPINTGVPHAGHHHRARRRNRHHIWLLSGVVAALAFTAAQATLTYCFNGRVYSGVTVADVPIGGLTQDQAAAKLQQKVEGVTINLKTGPKTYSVKPGDIGVSYDLSTTLADAMLQGRTTWFLPLGLWQAHSSKLQYALKVDQKKQHEFATQVATGTGINPVDATIVINNGVPTIQTDVKGKAVSAGQVETAIDRLAGDASSQQLQLEPKVQTAEIKADDLGPALQQTKELLAVPVTLTFQGKTFQPNAAQIGAWITFDKTSEGTKATLKPRVSTDAVKQYLATIAPQINVAPLNHKVNMQNGIVTDQQAGKDGTSLDIDALAAQISGAVTSKQPLTAEAPTKPVPFKTEYNNKVVLNLPKYVEVDLTKQHLWLYQDQKAIFDSPITSGATGAGFPTITGQFAIYAKETNRHLVGIQYGPRYNYDVFVHYWMPFSGGFGLHDASWRSAFGGPDYYYNGSHGCVNLPDATAAYLFNWADIGTPVWVH